MPIKSLQSQGNYFLDPPKGLGSSRTLLEAKGMGFGVLFSDSKGSSREARESFAGFPKFRVPFLGLPIIRTIVFWGVYWGPLIFGKYHLSKFRKFRF